MSSGCLPVRVHGIRSLPTLPPELPVRVDTDSRQCASGMGERYLAVSESVAAENPKVVQPVSRLNAAQRHISLLTPRLSRRRQGYETCERSTFVPSIGIG